MSSRLAVLLWGLLAVGAAAAAEPLTLTPEFQRLELQPTASTVHTLVVTGAPGTVVLATLADCACLRCLVTPPLTIPPLGRVEIPMRVSGVRAGIEDVAIVTTVGTMRARIQIVGPGAGTGLPVLTATLKQAQDQHLDVWGIVHGLAGNMRNCGCSSGALAGAGHLAALPAQAATLAPGVAMHWVLTGDVDGKRPGLGAALVEHGWSLGHPGVRVAVDVAPLLAESGVIAVIPVAPVELSHQRILYPALPLGMTVDLLLVDAHGRIQARRVLPVDATLNDDVTLAARFPDHLTHTIASATQPSKSCASCHPTAFVAWEHSRHAQAFARLPEADRTDTCVNCHTTPLITGDLAPNVNCQDCHQEASAHAMAPDPQRRPTRGTTDCRSCHDTQHHPEFDRETAWKAILHGREPAKRP